MSQKKKEEHNYYNIPQAKNQCFFNSVTGELMNLEDGNEEDMYEIIPDMDQNAQDNISQYTDISETDKHFFKLWNAFIKSKENAYNECYDLTGAILEFLKINSEYICKNNLKKNFVLHLIAVYDNRQIDDENLMEVIDKMDSYFEKYK